MSGKACCTMEKLAWVQLEVGLRGAAQLKVADRQPGTRHNGLSHAVPCSAALLNCHPHLPCYSATLLSCCPTGSQLGLIDTTTSQLTPLATGFTSFGRLAVTGPGLADSQGELTVVTVAGSATKGQAVVMLQVCHTVGLLGCGCVCCTGGEGKG